MYQSISLKDREKPKADSPYLFLINMLLKIDYLAYNNHLTTNCFLETLVRYAFFFTESAEFFQHIVTSFYSDKAILNENKSVASQATYQFLRLCESMHSKQALL